MWRSSWLARGARRSRAGLAAAVLLVLLLMSGLAWWSQQSTGPETSAPVQAVAPGSGLDPSAPDVMRPGSGLAEIDVAFHAAGRVEALEPKSEGVKALDLAPIHALLRDPLTLEPLRDTLCYVTDVKSVVVTGTTNHSGVLRASEPLLRGPVTLQIVNAEAQYLLGQGYTLEALAMGRKTYENGAQEVSEFKLPLVEGIEHSGPPQSPDIWDVPIEHFVALKVPEVGGWDVLEMGFTLASADGYLEAGTAHLLTDPSLECPDWIRTSRSTFLAVAVRKGAGQVVSRSTGWPRRAITFSSSWMAMRSSNRMGSRRWRPRNLMKATSWSSTTCRPTR